MSSAVVTNKDCTSTLCDSSREWGAESYQMQSAVAGRKLPVLTMMYTDWRATRYYCDLNRTGSA